MNGHVDLDRVRDRHAPDPTTPDRCTYCMDVKFPCDTLLLVDVVTRVRHALALDALSSARIASALGPVLFDRDDAYPPRRVRVDP